MYRIFALLGLLINSACGQTTGIPITEVSNEEIKNVLLLDVRTPQEFESGHIEGAVNRNWFDDDFDSQMKGVDKETKIYVYCKLGGRSLKAQNRLLQLGFTNVINLEGGYDAWSAAKE